MIPLAVQSPFAGLPEAVQVLFWFALIVIIGVDLWTVTLFVRGCRTAPHARCRRRPRRVLHLGVSGSRLERGGDDQRQRRATARGAGQTPPRGGDRRRLGRSHSRHPARARPPRSARDPAGTPGRADREGRGPQPRLLGAGRTARFGRPLAGDRRDRRRRRPARARRPQVRRNPLRRSQGRRRPIAGSDLQPPKRAGVVPGRRVRRVRPSLPGRAKRLGHRGDGRKRPVQPAERARRRGRRGRAVARSPDRGSGPRAASDRQGLGGPAGAAGHGRSAGLAAAAPAASPAHPLVAGESPGRAIGRRTRPRTVHARRPGRADGLPVHADVAGHDRFHVSDRAGIDGARHRAVLERRADLAARCSSMRWPSEAPSSGASPPAARKARGAG